MQEIEELGYAALWLGISPSLEQARPFLEQSSRLIVATGILNVWQHEPGRRGGRAMHELQREFDGRFLLGIGIGHPEATEEYTKPLTKMREFFDGLDAADQPVPREERVAAALGPKMLDLPPSGRSARIRTSRRSSTPAARANGSGRDRCWRPR